jgi:hypothetical protein
MAMFVISITRFRSRNYFWNAIIYFWNGHRAMVPEEPAVPVPEIRGPLKGPHYLFWNQEPSIGSLFWLPLALKPEQEQEQENKNRAGEHNLWSAG